MSIMLIFILSFIIIIIIIIKNIIIIERLKNRTLVRRVPLPEVVYLLMFGCHPL